MTTFFVFRILQNYKHMKKIAILIIAVTLATVGCNNNKEKNQQKQQLKTQLKSTSGNTTKVLQDKFPELTPEEHFHAIVSDTMTLSEVAKVNNIGLPFLKTKLGIPQYLKYDYHIIQLKKNYRFTIQKLKKLIEDSKNRNAVLQKNRNK